MPIIVIGINYKTAHPTLREKVYFAEEKVTLYLQDLLDQSLVKEAVLLSTCNRSELICIAEEIPPLLDWFHSQTTVAKEDLLPALYCYEELDALIHMTEVVVGLDSMILGEPQIFGQVKAAFSDSLATGAIGTVFQRIFPHVFKLGKTIRTMTSIGACPVSIASATMQFVHDRMMPNQQATILLIGAGETIELLLRYMQKSSVDYAIHIVNRTFENAKALADLYPVTPHQWHNLPDLLAEADWVLSATGSAQPIVTYNLLNKVMPLRKERPLHFIDLAIPRDIEPAISNMENVSLHCIDDLKTIIDKHRQGREHAALKAREMIREASLALMQDLHSIEHVSHTIRVYRSQIESLCHIELQKAKQQLRQGEDAEQVLKTFATTFTNKLLHVPSVQLRQAGREGRFELLHFAKQLFAVAE